MIMVRESDCHMRQSRPLQNIGRHKITAENEFNDSFTKFKESQKNSDKDTSDALFKYPQVIRRE